jgi:hypothetical protein
LIVAFFVIFGNMYISYIVIGLAGRTGISQIRHKTYIGSTHATPRFHWISYGRKNMKPNHKHFPLRAIIVLASFVAITVLAMHSGLAAPQAQAEEPLLTPPRGSNQRLPRPPWYSELFYEGR